MPTAQTHTARFPTAPAILDRGTGAQQFEMAVRVSTDQDRKVVVVMTRAEVEQLRDACTDALSFRQSMPPDNS